MGRDDGVNALIGQLREALAETTPLVWVQSSCRLVEKDPLRITGQRLGKVESTSLAARQAIGSPRTQLVQSDESK